MRNMLVIICFLFASYSVCYGATINVASPYDDSDVQTAVNAALDGDTIVIPACTVTWGTAVTISGKGLTIQGAGIANTIITDTTGTSNSAFEINTGGLYFTRITGIWFKGGDQNANIEITGGGANKFRIDNCKFTNPGASGRAVWVFDDTYGVIDSNYFADMIQTITVTGSDDTSWTTAIGFGSANAVYVEDNTYANTIRADGAIDASWGGRYVFRYNDVLNTFMGHHGFDSGGHRGTMQFEIYNNNFSTQINSPFTMYLSSGTGVVYSNTGSLLTPSGAYPVAQIRFRNMRSECNTIEGCDAYCIDCSVYPAPNNETCDGTSTNDTNSVLYTDTHDGAGNAATLSDAGATFTIDALIGMHVFNTTDSSSCEITDNDGTTITCSLAGGTDNDWDAGDTYAVKSGYPCKDQIGRGINQETSPVYVWGNDFTTWDDTVVMSTAGLLQRHIVADRDYFIATDLADAKSKGLDAGYTAYYYPHPLRDTTVPTLLSATIDETGGYITFRGAKNLLPTISTGFALTLSGGAATATYSSGTGTAYLVYSLSRTVASGETGTYDYTQPEGGNGIEDQSGNDLASITGGAITNNSTSGAASIGSMTMSGAGSMTGIGTGSGSMTIIP